MEREGRERDEGERETVRYCSYHSKVNCGYL